MTNDLVEELLTLSTPERRKHGSPPDIAMKKAADRIKQLQKLLEMRDVFIVKHGLWHEFCDSLELKNE